jgi:hypothetical protein
MSPYDPCRRCAPPPRGPRRHLWRRRAGPAKLLLGRRDAMMDQDGEIPPPRTIEAAVADTEIMAAVAGGAVIVLIPLVREAGRAIRANILLDRGLLDAIDEAAAPHPRPHALGFSGLRGARKDRQ